MRVINWPEAMLAPMRPNIIGVINVPELVALMPRTPWKMSGTKMIVPNIPKPDRNPTTTDTEKTLFLKRPSGTIGSSTRCSTKKNATSIAPPRARRPSTCQEFHP